MFKKLLIATMILTSLHALEIKDVSLNGEHGGFVNGKTWTFSQNQNKVRLIFYVDPDERAKGKNFKGNATKLEELYLGQNFKVQVILNLDATWVPTALISSKIKSKQEDRPQRDFILDKDKTLVKKWGIADNEYNVLVFDNSNKLIYQHSGDVSKEDIKTIYKLIDQEMSKI